MNGRSLELNEEKSSDAGVHLFLWPGDPVDLDDPAALLEMGNVTMSAGDAETATAHISAPVRLLTTAGDNRRAPTPAMRRVVDDRPARSRPTALRPARTGAGLLRATGERTAGRPAVAAPMGPSGPMGAPSGRRGQPPFA